MNCCRLCNNGNQSPEDAAPKTIGRVEPDLVKVMVACELAGELPLPLNRESNSQMP